MTDEVARVKADFPLLARGEVHYLDSAATAQTPLVVVEAMREFETRARANVHGDVHRLSRAAIVAYRRARGDVARFINAPAADEIVFTYGATSAINLVASSFGELMRRGDEIVLSELEHHSNLVPWQMLAQRRGLELRFLPATEDGRLDLDGLDRAVTERCRLVAVTHCSNVTGAVTDIAPIVRAARAVGATVLIDGAQQVPHEPVDVQSLGADFYAFSGHKMYGPTGIGVLWARSKLLEAMPPFLTGGQMTTHVTYKEAAFAAPPQKFEAGTPPIAGAVGLGAAVRWCEAQDWSASLSRERRLTARILTALTKTRGVRVLGPTDVKKRRGVVSFDLAGVHFQDLCRILDDRGVAVRGGNHCAQLVMDRFGIDGATRVSLAVYSDDDDVDAFVSALAYAARNG